MPSLAPRICSCGKVAPRGIVCACRKRTHAEAKARHDEKRPNATARGYDHEWRRESKAFLALNPRCQHAGCNGYATVVDHKAPHRGDKRLFWDRRNWQSLCAHHHNADKQRMECR